MKKLGLFFLLFFFFFSCRGTTDGGTYLTGKTFLVNFASDNEKIATVEVFTEDGIEVKNGDKLNSGTKITLSVVFKDYNWEVEAWKINSQVCHEKLKTFSHTVVENVSFFLKLNKLIFDESKPNIVFKIPEVGGKDEVDVMLHLAGEKAGDSIQIDFGDGMKVDYILPSKEPSRINKRIDIPSEVKIYGKLTHFNAVGNKYINEIYFYNSNNLNVVKLSQNKISKIDLTTIPACKELHITDNMITEVDIKHCRELEEFYCGYNKVLNIDLSQNKRLNVLTCYNTEIKELDISNNPLLEVLTASDNKYSKEIIFDNNPLLRAIDLENSALSSIELSSLKKLKTLRLKGNKLSSINLENNILIEYLDIGENRLESLDVSMLPLLEQLRCNKNKLKNLELSKNTKLNIVNIKDNEFSACSLNELFLSMNSPADLKNNGFAIGGNAGTATSSTKIAEDKGWKLDEKGDGSTSCSTD